MAAFCCCANTTNTADEEVGGRRLSNLLVVVAVVVVSGGGSNTNSSFVCVVMGLCAASFPNAASNRGVVFFVAAAVDVDVDFGVASIDVATSAEDNVVIAASTATSAGTGGLLILDASEG